MKIGAIIQARQTSIRLPGKALIDLCGKPALQRVIERVRQSKVNDVIVACTVNPADDVIEELCKKLNCNYFRGSEEDVLNRVLSAAKVFDIDVIVEITADCPLIDWNHIDYLLSKDNSCWDMRSNIIERSFPRGFDIRIFDTKKLEELNNIIDNPIDRQHVATAFYLNDKFKNNYNNFNWIAPINQRRPDLDITLDTPEDLELIRWLFKAGEEYRLDLTCQEVIHLIDTYPEKYTKVAEIKRKDYFQELQEFYDKERTNNESVDNRSRRTGSVSGCTRKR